MAGCKVLVAAALLHCFSLASAAAVTLINKRSDASERRTFGAVWLVSQDEAYIGDVSQCVHGCTYNRLCGTRDQCSNSPSIGSRLLIFAAFILGCVGLNALSKRISEKCLVVPSESTMTRARRFRKHSFVTCTR